MTTALPMARKHPTFAKGESCCKSFSFKVSNAILLAKAKPKSLSLASLITRTTTFPFSKSGMLTSHWQCGGHDKKLSSKYDYSFISLSTNATYYQRK